MEALYHQTNRLIQETQQYFQQLNNTQNDPSVVENEIQTKLITANA